MKLSFILPIDKVRNYTNNGNSIFPPRINCEFTGKRDAMCLVPEERDVMCLSYLIGTCQLRGFDNNLL